MESKNLQLPKTWAEVNLGDFVENDKGKKPKNESKVQTAVHILPYVDIQAFEENVIRTWTDGIGCRLCSETDFLMVWDGSRSGLVGKGVNGALGSTLVRINFPSMVNDYAYYFLQSKYQQINTRAKGSGTPHVDPDLLWNYKFPIPPLAEQHRIVGKIEELFSELDKGIENLKTALAQLKVYRQALLKHAFEGKLTTQWREQNKDKLETASALQQRIQTERAARYQQQLADWQAVGQKGIKPKAPKLLPPLTNEELTELPELPKNWCWVKVGVVGRVGTGITPLKGRSDFYANGNIPWVTSGALNDNFVTEASDYVTELALKQTNLHIYPKHTLLIALYGEGKTRGKCSELLIEATTNQAIAAIVLDGTSEKLRKYMKWFFQKNYSDIRLKSSGGVQPNLNLGIIENTLFPMCSTEEASYIVDSIESKLSEIEQLEQTITTALQQSEALRQSILKKAFSGTLVAQDANDEPASVLLARIKAEKDAQTVITKPRKTKKAQVLPEPVKTNVIPFPVKIPNISATDLHAGIIARAYQLHENSKRLDYYGHVKAEKIGHLVESQLGIDLERIPFKDAAGPNDYPHLKKVESRARKAGWFEVRQAQKDGAYVFSRLNGFDALVNKTANILGDRLSEVDALLKLLLPMNTRQAEIVATLYAGWNNLLLLGQTPSDDEIVYESRENWHTDKLNIERDRFFKALVWMREHQLVPMGKGRYVKNKE